MLIIIIYAAIGLAALILFIFLFSKMGRVENESRPDYIWEKIVEDYGDPTLINLYKTACQ